MSIRDEPHFEITAVDLAAWIEQQGADRWWCVDGDPLLTGRIPYPAPGDEVAEDLRKINRVLLVRDKQQRPDSRGQRIGPSDLDGLAEREGEGLPPEPDRPLFLDDRVFYLSWKGGDIDWELNEDLETTERIRRVLAEEAKE
jgi:hypothetical protein